VLHYSGDRLIWLNDIHLLARNLTPEHVCMALAAEKGLRAVCVEGIESARMLRHAGAQRVLQTLPAPASRREAAAACLEAKQLRRRWLDRCTHETPGSKLRFAAALMFSPKLHA
jgi:hypothetical protein